MRSRPACRPLDRESWPAVTPPLAGVPLYVMTYLRRDVLRHWRNSFYAAELRLPALRFQMPPEGHFQHLLVCQLLVESISAEPIVKFVIDPES
jgi:hypothetical protein